MRILSISPFFSVLLYAQSGGSISGRVTNSVTGAGIEGVRIQVCPSAGSETRCGTTHYQSVSDIAGAYRIAGMPDGPYAVVNIGPKDGFNPNNAGKGGFPQVAVSGNSRLDLQMTPFASVRGRVLDPEGKPAAGIAVKFSGRETMTGEHGEFLFKDVPPGGGRTLSATPKPLVAAKDGIQIVTTYYPSVVDAGQAAMLDVTGVDASYDIRLQAAPARAIRGVVIGTDGKPAPEARITITGTEPGIISFVRGITPRLPKSVEATPSVVTAQDGTFAFPPVLEGDWALRANLLRGQILSGTTRVTVSTRDPDPTEIRNVEIRLATPLNVDVTADWGDSPPASIRTLATFLPVGSQPPSFEGLRRPATYSGKPQRFELSAGRYLILEGRALDFSGAPGFYAAAAMLDGHDVLGQIVDLSSSASLKMVYKQGGGAVRGTVERGPNAIVILMADATPAARLGYSGKCDANGSFFIPDLPPGDYTAMAVAGPDPGDPLRPEFASALARDGKRIKIEAGSPAQVDLRLSLTR